MDALLKLSHFPNARTWRKSLSGIHGSEKASALISNAQARYDDLWAMHSADENRRNRVALKTRILPCLAIYQALLDENGDRQKVLAEMEILSRAAAFSARMQGIRLLNHLPDPFPIVKPVLKMMTGNEYLPGSQEIVEDSAECFPLFHSRYT